MLTMTFLPILDPGLVRKHYHCAHRAPPCRKTVSHRATFQDSKCNNNPKFNSQRLLLDHIAECSGGKFSRERNRACSFQESQAVHALVDGIASEKSVPLTTFVTQLRLTQGAHADHGPLCGWEALQSCCVCVFVYICIASVTYYVGERPNSRLYVYACVCVCVYVCVCIHIHRFIYVM